MRGFSLVHDPEGSHYILEGKVVKALARGTEWMSLRRVVTLSEAKGLDIRDSSPTVQNDKRDKAISSQQGKPGMRRAWENASRLARKRTLKKPETGGVDFR